jgi:hypothetical protein
MTTTTITDEQIEALRTEAMAAGDAEQVAICDRASTGDEPSRVECARVIAAARAMASVMDYQTGAEMDGTASAELIEASLAEHSGTGAVAAYRDEHGVWQHVPESQESFFRDQRGEDVRTVYVQD